LGASNYTFAEATWSQKVPDWIGSHVRAFEYFGGVSELVIPDNLRSGVTKPCRYEPALNTTYHELAQYYGVAVIPARVRRPKDKAKVEVGVLVVERWILACLRRRQFFSLRELNDAIAEHLERLNSRRFKKLPGSRRSLFEALDQPALRPLPATPFEDCDWRKVRVRRDYHVEVDGHFYSVPFQLVDRQLEVRLTATGVECLHHEQRVACHPRSAVVGTSTTCKEHMPPAHRSLAEQTPETVSTWAEQAGPSTAQVVSRILASRAHPQQGLQACQGLRRLGRDYGLDRLEGACRYALEIHGFSFTSVRSILERGLDRHEPRAQPAAGKAIVHDNVRGAKYFQTEAQPEEVSSC
jgi:transposase